MRLTVEEIYKIACDVNPDRADLLTAIVLTESSGETNAIRYEPNFRAIDVDVKPPASCTKSTELICQRISWGLAQVMGATARWLGVKGWLTALLDPRLNLETANQYLDWLFGRCTELRDVISAYNAGVPTWRKADGNESYVLKVEEALKYVRQRIPMGPEPVED